MRRLVGVFLTALVLVSALAAVAGPVGIAAAAGNSSAGAGGDSGGAGPSSTTSGEEFTYSELSDTGTQIEGKDPSSRYLGRYSMVYVSYAETNFIKELSEMNEPSWAVDKVITPGKTVDTQTVTMHVTRYRNAPTETVKVHVVQWQEKRVDVAEGNETRMQPVATNQTHRVHKVELTGASDRVKIPLPHTDPKRQVTMWVETDDGSARWVFPHDPVATTNATPFDATWSSFLPWFATRFFLVTLLGVPLAIGAGVKTLEETFTGPGKGAAWWFIVPGILSYIAGYLAMGQIAGLLVTAPWSMGLLVVGMAYVATLEYADQTYDLLVEQVTTVEATNALGEGTRDIEGEAGALFHAVDLDGQRVALVKKGSLKMFLLVALTDAEWPILDLSDMKSRIEYGRVTKEGRKVADAKLYGDETEDDVIVVRWPSLTIGLSNLKVSRGDEEETEEVDTIGDGWSKEKVSSAFLWWGVGTVVASAFLGTGAKAAAAGLVPLSYVASDVESGSATFWAAPEHATKAKASRTAEKHELTVAQTFEEMQQSEADREADVAEIAVDIADSRTKRSRERLRRLLGLEDDDGKFEGTAATTRPDATATDGGAPDAGGDD